WWMPRSAVLAGGRGRWRRPWPNLAWTPLWQRSSRPSTARCSRSSRTATRRSLKKRAGLAQISRFRYPRGTWNLKR
ncbi:unnamed protein product, partial [Symbiodinium sp. CCMP2456]